MRQTLCFLSILCVPTLHGQTFKGHHIGETAAEFLAMEPVIQARLTSCQANAPHELSPEEIKTRYGKKALQEFEKRNAENDAKFGGHPPSHIGVMSRDADLYGEECGPVIESLVAGTGRIDGVGSERHNHYWGNILDRTKANPMSSDAMQLDSESMKIESNYDILDRQFYFEDGKLASLSLKIPASVDSIKDDLTKRVNATPVLVSIPMNNAYGATWNNISLFWDSPELHVELSQDENPAAPSVPRLSVESQVLYKKYQARRKAAPSPLD